MSCFFLQHSYSTTGKKMLENAAYAEIQVVFSNESLLNYDRDAVFKANLGFSIQLVLILFLNKRLYF